MFFTTAVATCWKNDRIIVTLIKLTENIPFLTYKPGNICGRRPSCCMSCRSCGCGCGRRSGCGSSGSCCRGQDGPGESSRGEGDPPVQPEHTALGQICDHLIIISCS